MLLFQVLQWMSALGLPALLACAWPDDEGALEPLPPAELSPWLAALCTSLQAHHFAMPLHSCLYMQGSKNSLQANY